MLRSILLLLLVCDLSIRVYSTDCASPHSDIEEEYCNTVQLIGLYNRKLTILQSMLGLKSNTTHQPTSLQPPFSHNPNLYVRGNAFKGETVFVPPDKVINQGNFYEINGNSLRAKQSGKIIAINDVQVLCYVGDHLKIYNNKNLNDLKATELDNYGMYKQGIKGLILAKTPKILIQYYKNQMYVVTRAGHNRNITFEKQILNVIKGYNNQAVYMTLNQFGIVSITSSDLKQKKFHLEYVLNATSDGIAYVYVLTGEGRLFIFDFRNGQQIGSTHLYEPNNISTTLTICDNKLFIHRMNQPYILVYNISAKQDIRGHDNITVCKTGNYQPHMYRYHIQCGGTFVHLLCGSGYGPTSDWKYGMYFVKTHIPPQQFPKQLIAIGGVVAIAFLYALNMFWKKKKSGKQKANRIIKEEDEREEEEKLLQKLTGTTKQKPNIKKEGDLRSKKNN